MVKETGLAMKVAGMMGPGSRANSTDRVCSPGPMDDLMRVHGKMGTNTAQAL